MSLVLSSLHFTLGYYIQQPLLRLECKLLKLGYHTWHGISVLKRILRHDGIPGLYRGFATSAIGSLPGRVLALTSLEVSKDIMFKNTEGLNVSEATRIALSNGVAGLVSNMVSCVYFVPLDVISQRLMVQGLPEMTTYNGPFDVIRKVMKKEGIRSLYRGFGITVATQSPATALWWGAAQHVYLEERSLGYGNDVEQKLSQLQLVAVQEKPEHWLVLVHRLSLLR